MNMTNIAGRIFQNLYPKLANSIAGYFNLPKMDWDNMSPSPDCKHPSFYRQITEVLNDSNLSPYQLVIPIFLISSLLQIRLRVSILLGISDHDIVQIQVNTSAKILFQKPRSISLYKKANWDGMKQALEAYHEDMLESGKYSS